MYVKQSHVRKTRTCEMYSKFGQKNRKQQMNKEILLELINKASANAGNDNQLAKKIKTNRSTISDWRTGRATCPIADVALMAQLAGYDAEKWALSALMWQYEGKEKGVLLKQAIKKAVMWITQVNGIFRKKKLTWPVCSKTVYLYSVAR